MDALAWFEEVFFYRLIVNCDDYGRFDARPTVLKARLFPLKLDLDMEDISAALEALVSRGMISLYESGGKPYLQLTSWLDHQKPRAMKSKFPDPPQAAESICSQVKSDAPDIRNTIFDTRYSPSDTRTSEEKAPEKKGFIAPTEKEVSDLCREEGLSVDPKRFIAYYSKNGWKTRMGPMTDWKAALRAWHSQGKKNSGFQLKGEADQRAREDMERLRAFLAREKAAEAP